MTRCRRRRDPDTGKLYDHPECIGGAVYGFGSCTCTPKPADPDEEIDQVEEIAERLKNLENTVAELKTKIAAQMERAEP